MNHKYQSNPPIPSWWDMCYTTSLREAILKSKYTAYQQSKHDKMWFWTKKITFAGFIFFKYLFNLSSLQSFCGNVLDFKNYLCWFYIFLIFIQSFLFNRRNLTIFTPGLGIFLQRMCCIRLV